MLDVELARKPYSNQLTDAQLPDAEGITPEQRMDSIAAILAIAALRSRYRKANNANNLKNIAGSSGTFREKDLILLRERASFMTTESCNRI
ncbi:hypothetical protein MASR1M66_03520 [Aminivibrio sp.]